MHWKQLLAEAFRTPADLLRYLEIDSSSPNSSADAQQQFRMLVPRGFANRMEKGNPDDPLLRQVLPIAAELDTRPGFTLDPVGDLQSQQSPGLLHKYRGRVLLINSGGCAINCRYCFRRHFPYAHSVATADELDIAVDMIRRTTDIEEVIFSGGDPLLMRDASLARLVGTLETIPHVRRLRIHSRMPVVLPERITPQLLGVLGESRLGVVMVIHANHARELSNDVAERLAEMRSNDITMLNQSVLLSGVNATVDTLAELSTRLFETGTLPYYLHVLDPVAGAAHFEVPFEQIQHLQSALRARLPGYLVPRFVAEEAGKSAKTPFDLIIPRNI